MSALTFITLAVIVYGAASQRGYVRALALSGGTPAGAAVAFGTTALPTFYAVAFGSAVALALAVLSRGRSRLQHPAGLPPGALLLVLLLVWSVVVTLVAPYLFDGIKVLEPGPTYRTLTAGLVTSSNTAQALYLLLGICVVIHVARSPGAGPEIIGTAAGLVTVLSMWRYTHSVAGIPFPERLFDNSPGFVYIETLPGGAPRVRGILSEPAGLATSSLVTMAYMIPRAVNLRGRRRLGAMLVSACATYLGLVSTSTTFFVAGGVLAGLAALWLGGGFLLRRVSMRAFVGVIGCAVVIATIWLLPILVDFLRATVHEKVQSSSYGNRSEADTIAYNVFTRTFGFGVGLGSNRASSFFSSLLGAVGLPGMVLFVGAIVTIIRRSLPMRSYRPVAWALVALLVVKVISGPDLSDPSGILWLSLGLLAKAATEAKAPRVGGHPSPIEPRPALSA